MLTARRIEVVFSRSLRKQIKKGKGWAMCQALRNAMTVPHTIMHYLHVEETVENYHGPDALKEYLCKGLWPTGRMLRTTFAESNHMIAFLEPQQGDGYTIKVKILLFVEGHERPVFTFGAIVNDNGYVEALGCMTSSIGPRPTRTQPSSVMWKIRERQCVNRRNTFGW